MRGFLTDLSRLFRRPEATPTQAAKTLATISAEKRRAKRAAYVKAHCQAILDSM